MGTTRFKLFSSTGPSVAMGLVMALAATLTLTPALLVLLARIRPRAFDGLAGAVAGFWERLGSGHGPAAAELGADDPGDAAAGDPGSADTISSRTWSPSCRRDAGRSRTSACWPRSSSRGCSPR